MLFFWCKNFETYKGNELAVTNNEVLTKNEMRVDIEQCVRNHNPKLMVNKKLNHSGKIISYDLIKIFIGIHFDRDIVFTLEAYRQANLWLL
jgi:hypothetical protein